VTSEANASAGRPDPSGSGFSPWLYLVFLAFVFIAPAFDPTATAVDWIIAGSIVVVAGAVFVVAGGHARYRLPGSAALLVVGVAGTILGTGAMGVVPIYAAALAAVGAPRRLVYRRLALITAVTVASAFLSPVPMPFRLFIFVSPLVLVWLVGLSILEDAGLARQADALRAENARIEYLATVTERERIARDLHDLAGQALTAVALRSQLVQRLAVSDPARVAAEAEAIEETARETLSSLRSTVAGWQQVALDDELGKAVSALEAAGVRTQTSGSWRTELAPSVETVLALALREAVTNVVRHAGASTCAIRLSTGGGEVLLEVRDDGSGEDAPEGSGLRGMRERVVAAGGRVDRRMGGAGTTIRVAIPVGAQP
jgi:two-component system, NarL family, sensor histidine kinase DesK